TSASLTLQLTCFPRPAGAPLTLAAQNCAGIPTPTVPGPQALPTCVYTIPANTLQSGVPYVCRVVGVYTVDFGAGTGSGSLAATGDTEVCIVPPAPGQPSVPRLDVRLL